MQCAAAGVLRRTAPFLICTDADVLVCTGTWSPAAGLAMEEYRENFGDGIILPIIGLVLVIAIAIGAIVSRYKIAQPNEAIIITGSGSSRRSDDGLPAAQKIVQGGGTFVVPFIQRAHRMSLESRKITVSASALSKTNIEMNLTAIAIVKVGGADTSVRAAAQRFLDKQDEISPLRHLKGRCARSSAR